NLEDVFLKVCRAEDEKLVGVSMPPTMASMRANASNGQHLQSVTTAQTKKVSHSTNTVQRFGALIEKNFISLYRQKMLFLIQIVMPMIGIALFCACIGGKLRDLDVVVYNEDSPALLSEIFLTHIDNKTILWNRFADNGSAYNEVKVGNAYGELVFGPNFTAALMARAAATNLQVSDETIAMSTAMFYADLTDMNIYQTLFKSLLETNFAFMKDMLNRSALNPKPNIKALNPIVNVNKDPIYGTTDPKFREFMTPGLIVLMSYLLAIGLTALSTITERREGLLERSLVAGVHMYEILMSHVFVQIIILVFQTSLVMITVFMFFKIDCKGSYLLVFLLSILQGICGMCFGLLVSAIAENTRTALIIIVGSLMPYLIISGIVWPLEGMDSWVQWVATPMPQTLPVIALRNVIFKGWGLKRTLEILMKPIELSIESIGLKSDTNIRRMSSGSDSTKVYPKDSFDRFGDDLCKTDSVLNVCPNNGSEEYSRHKQISFFLIIQSL
ncbi:unnamed protein product, partial [Medioppia subpectinata]